MARSGCMERWRSVPGHGGVFIASSEGRVARVVGHKNGNGYWAVSLTRAMKPFKAHSMGRRDRRQMRGLVHHLVALAFLGRPPRGKNQVNHKDNDPFNNRPGNLEWSTQRENVLHAWRTGRIPRTRLGRLPENKVNLIIKLRLQGTKYSDISKIARIKLPTVGYRIRRAKQEGLL